MKRASIGWAARGIGLTGLVCLLLSFWLNAAFDPAPVQAFAQQPAVGGEELETARRMIRRSDFKSAEPVLRELTQRDTQSADAGFLLGYVLLRLNRPKESLVEYTRAAALRTPTPEDLRHVADDYVLLDDLDDAEKWVLKSIEMSEKLGWPEPESWYAFGRIRYTQQRFQDAVQCFEKALVMAPRNVKVENNLGLAYQALNRNAEALAAFHLAVEWQKDDAHPSEQPMLNLAIVDVEEGRLKEALPLLMQAAAIAPKDAKIREQLGQLYLQQNQFADAQRELETAVALAPESESYHYLLGRVYQKQGQVEKARAEFGRSAALNGTQAKPKAY